MAPTTTTFVFSIFQPIWKTKHVLETQFYKLSIFTCMMIYFQNGGYIQDGLFTDF
jgi:hypothetical protein